MKRTHVHVWPQNADEALAIQRQLAPLVVETPLTKEPQTVAGVDMGAHGSQVRATVVVLKLPGLEVIDQAVWEGETSFPYVPGLLSFREIPALLKALEQLQLWPDLIMVDGQGRAHPRRLGIASHLGVLLDMPTIGVAKSLLTGRHGEVAVERGAQTPLLSRGETIGVVLRTRAEVRPLYVSVGHRITLPEAVHWVLACTTKYRLPETTRLADKLSKRTKPT